MRLLRGSANPGLYEFVTFNDRDPLPPYAILSHRWSQHEPTFQDAERGNDRLSKQDPKLDFCHRQAREDGIEYFWVDTVCIDRSSSAELQEAINSSFAWYKGAQKCYVYLTDIVVHDEIIALEDLKDKLLGRALEDRKTTALPLWYEHHLNIGSSEWFKRGWTLSELLAPKCVEFYSKNEVFLGDKRSLEQTIIAATKIPASALQGASLSSFSVEERFSWLEGRETTKIEDQAYCMLGIFDVFLQIVYGERDRARIRLHDAINEWLFRDRTRYSRSISNAGSPTPSNTNRSIDEEPTVPQLRVRTRQETANIAHEPPNTMSPKPIPKRQTSQMPSSPATGRATQLSLRRSVTSPFPVTPNCCGPITWETGLMRRFRSRGSCSSCGFRVDDASTYESSVPLDNRNGIAGKYVLQFCHYVHQIMGQEMQLHNVYRCFLCADGGLILDWDTLKEHLKILHTFEEFQKGMVDAEDARFAKERERARYNGATSVNGNRNFG